MREGIQVLRGNNNVVVSFEAFSHLGCICVCTMHIEEGEDYNYSLIPGLLPPLCALHCVIYTRYLSRHRSHVHLVQASLLLFFFLDRKYSEIAEHILGDGYII